MKGASPLIATIILLLITIASGGMFYIYMRNTQEKLISNAEEASSIQDKRLYGKITILSVWNESSKLCFLLRNTSDKNIVFTVEDLMKFSYLINNVPYDIETGSLHSISQGDALTICFCNDISCGKYYQYNGGEVVVSVIATNGYKSSFVYNEEV